MDPDFGVGTAPRKREPWRTTLVLAYQSLGVVYKHSEGNEEIHGALSFVFWTLTLIPLLKYATIVLRADDNGEGGTFALCSLICRHANVSLLPNRRVADEELSTYRLEADGRSRVKAWLEKHARLHTAHQIQELLAVGCSCSEPGRAQLNFYGEMRSGLFTVHGFHHDTNRFCRDA